MPAADAGVAVTKLVTVHPGNAARGLPTIGGEVVAMRAETGERLGVLEGAAVTARRTAALSLLAAGALTPRADGALWIPGAGKRARSHLEAFHEGLGTQKVFILSRGEQKARALADRARTLGMEASVIGNVAEALAEASLIAATTSAEPVLPEEIPADAFVAPWVRSARTWSSYRPWYGPQTASSPTTSKAPAKKPATSYRRSGQAP